MSTTTEPGATPPTVAVEKDEPWRYGSRYLRHVRPDGEVSYEEVPLKKEDLLYPEEGDRPVLTEGHVNDCAYLRDVLKNWAADVADALVLSDHRVDWQAAGLQPLGPDVVVFRNVTRPWDPDRGTFPVVDYGARTLLAIEVTSPDTRPIDLKEKVELYHRAGVPLYAIVDRHQTRAGVDLGLFGYRMDPVLQNHYMPIALDARGRLWLETVGLWLATENGQAVCYDDKGNRSSDYVGLDRAKKEADARAAAEAKARQAADARAQGADARNKELEAELQRLRAQGQGRPPNPAAP
jgi:Uma2 family endonuclease